MLKKKAARFFRQANAVFIAFAVLGTTLLQSMEVHAATETTPEAETASETTAEVNMLINSGFEPEEAELSSDSYEGVWHTQQGAVKVQDEMHTGKGAAKLPNTDASLEQDVSGLQSGVTYVYSVWAKADSLEGSSLQLGVKNHGSGELSLQIDSTEWKEYSVEFVSTNGQARCYATAASSQDGASFYVDDAKLTVKSDIKKLSVKNGSIRLEFKEGMSSVPSASDFEVSYESSLNPKAAAALPVTDNGLKDGKLEMAFTPIEKQPAEQTITLYIKYKPSGQSFTENFTLEACEEAEQVAKLISLSAANGELTAILDKVPTVAPKADDFTIKYKIDEEAEKDLAVSEITYDKENRKVVIGFNRLPSAAEPQTISIKVVYRESRETAQFTIGAEGGEAVPFAIGAVSGGTYYIAADGNDNNDGLTPETPFLSIDKLNTLTFMPGDHILFKKGDVFTGSFKPQGSGSDGAPIVVASYGDGDAAKPVLQPGTTNWNSLVMTADTRGNDERTVNNGITFYNQEYWEVRDLELSNPNSPGGPNTSGVYQRGINITGIDTGELEHFYFDNLTIHGFHGPNDNLGKSSGGILMEVQSVAGEAASQHTPTSINDIRITNCELYDLGRSGVNFVTVWGRRAETTDTKWGPYPSNHGGYWKNYTRTAYKDFYFANNYVHNIDGDGCIVDTCDNAVVENNLVYSCEQDAPMAVGLFNWNSDDTLFQYNEVYATQPGGDAQGIEIDALNDRTYVQYNYIHDNAGGSIMWCNTNGLYGFDGVFRYNIFQNDGRDHGVIDWRPGSFNAQCYNNTFYLGAAPDSTGEKQNFVTGDGSLSEMSFYNNIFYNAHSTPFNANAFHEDRIDYKNNLFYNFANVPSGDARNVVGDPMFVDPGKGGNGGAETDFKPVDFSTLSGYKLQKGSPAIDGGYIVKDNGGLDFFGNKVEGVPDIGASDSGSVGLKLASVPYTINHKYMTVTMPDSSDLKVEAVLGNLKADKGVNVSVYREDSTVSSGTEVQDGDIIKVSRKSDGEEAIYSIKIAHDENLLLITSDVYQIDLALNTVGIAEGDQYTVAQLLGNITYNEKADVLVMHGTKVLANSEIVQIGDKIVVKSGRYQASYYITLAEDASSDARDIPLSYLTATAGSEQPQSGSEGPASFVLDDNASTFWHSLWAGDVRENLYITLKISDGNPCLVDGIRYLPRTGALNGVITKYRLQYSADGITFHDIPGGTGNWGLSGWQSAHFAPVEAKAIRLYADESRTQEAGKEFATASEIRLTGVEKTSVDAVAPSTPSNVKADSETISSAGATIVWNVVSDADTAGYLVYVNGNEEIHYVRNAKINFYTLAGLEPDTDYTVEVSAVDSFGNESGKASTAFRTLGIADEDTPTVPANLKAINVYEKKAELSWSESADDVGVTGYEITVNGAVSCIVEENSTILTGLEGNKEYTVKVKALDAAGNKSPANRVFFKTVDKSGLLELLKKAQETMKNLDKYLDGTEKDKFKEAVKSAENTAKNEDAKEAEVTDAYGKLNDALNALKKVPDPNPDPGTKPDPDPGTKPDPNPGTKPDPDPGTKPNPDPGTKPSQPSEILNRINKAAAGETITIKAASTNAVFSKDIFQAAKDKDVTLKITLENGVIWTIRGKDIKTVQELNLGVSLNTNNIPADVVNGIKDSTIKKRMQISLAHDGDLGMLASISLPAGKEYAGGTAKLYYYNPNTGKLELVGTAEIDNEGTVSFGLTHASDYVMAVSQKQSKPRTGDDTNVTMYILLLMMAAVAAVGAKKYQTVRK